MKKKKGSNLYFSDIKSQECHLTWFSASLPAYSISEGTLNVGLFYSKLKYYIEKEKTTFYVVPISCSFTG